MQLQLGALCSPVEQEVLAILQLAWSKPVDLHTEPATEAEL